MHDMTAIHLFRPGIRLFLHPVILLFLKPEVCNFNNLILIFFRHTRASRAGAAVWLFHQTGIALTVHRKTSGERRLTEMRQPALN
jgi:hypothetical protein